MPTSITAPEGGEPKSAAFDLGRLSSLAPGAAFIGLIQNGMDLARIESYLQGAVVGASVILAVPADQMRYRLELMLED